MSEATIPIKELMEKTEQWLLGQGYKKSTLGFYRATWNRFLSYICLFLRNSICLECGPQRNA